MIKIRLFMESDIPDGLGVTYKYQHIKSGAKVDLDDDLVLWLMKKLK